MKRLLVVAALLFVLPAHAEVTFDWVTVGGPGNTCETQSQGCFGAVANTYRISKFETTNAQYAEFLNAVATTDTYGLYNASMGIQLGGISRSGSPGSYTYNAIVGRENRPVNHVSFWDALRFANWLQNGQPTGAQGTTTTENGAYTLTPDGIANNTVVRNTSVATFFITSEDEWYKAAYYDPVSMSYFDYPAGTDTPTVCAAPGDTPNAANCEYAVEDYLSEVGSYTASVSPSGTFDQGGNVSEWTEAILNQGVSRGQRGGAFFNDPSDLSAPLRADYGPTGEINSIGIRIATRSYPAPSMSPVGMAMLGGLVLAIAVGGLAVQRRRRAG